MELTCAVCENAFEKDTKEYNRRVRQGATAFYCSLSCAGKYNKRNLNEQWQSSPENLALLAANRAAGCATKYSSEEKPFAEYVRRARARKKQEERQPTDLTVSYLAELWTKQGGKCVWSGIPLCHPEPRGGMRPSADFNIQASLDRIDSSKGYVQGNVQFVSCALNFAKSNRDDSAVIALIQLLKKHATA